MKMEWRMVRNISRLDAVFRAMDDQKSETCGPYSLLKIARSSDIEYTGELDEDRLAQLSGTTISTDEEDLSRNYRGMPPGEVPKEDHESFYPLRMKVSEREEELGTSAEGVLRAAEVIMGGKYSVLPFSSRNRERINFSEETFSRMGDVIWNSIEEIDLNAILNIQVDLLASNKPMENMVDLYRFIMKGGEMETDSWSVGHFVVLAGMIRVERGAGRETFYILQDSYKKRGMNGYIIQPERYLRQALVRNDGKEGGMILIFPEIQEKLSNLLLSISRCEIWDNGTPYDLLG